MKQMRFRLAGLMGLIALISIAFASIRFATELWAGMVLSWTILVLCASSLGAAYRTGSLRAFWVGFTLFGLVYMVAIRDFAPDDVDRRSHLPTSVLLESVRPYVHRDPPTFQVGIWGGGGFCGTSFGSYLGPKTLRSRLEWLIHDPDAPNRSIRDALMRRAPIRFRGGIPLDEFLQWIRTSSIDPSRPVGLSIYTDPIALQEAEKTSESVIILDLPDLSLGQALEIGLEQLGLGYEIRDGLVRIVHRVDGDERPSFRPDAFARIGHCWFALLLGCMGGAIARRMHEPAGETSAAC